MAKHMRHLKDMDMRFKQRIHQHYDSLKKFRNRRENKRIIFFTLLLLIYLGIIYAHHSNVITIPDVLLRSSTLIITILLTFTLSSVVVRLLTGRFFLFFENEIEIEKRLFYTKLFTFLIYLGAFLFILYKLGITLSNLTLVAGLITTAFALSMRDVLASYMAWMVLLFKRPFRIGDFIKIGDDEGQVEHIGTFFVTIDDGTDNPLRSVKVPTQTFLTKTVTSYGVDDVPELIRLRLHSLPVDMGQRIEKINAAVKDITGYAHPEVTLEIEAEFPVLVIHYETAFVQKKNVKTKVLLKVLTFVDDVRKITK
jgi:MscS family membrane protein